MVKLWYVLGVGSSGLGLAISRSLTDGHGLWLDGLPREAEEGQVDFPRLPDHEVGIDGGIYPVQVEEQMANGPKVVAMLIFSL